MSKRWWYILAFCLLGMVLCALESQRILTGWLRGEAFYQGRPTSYWRAELKQWNIKESKGGLSRLGHGISWECPWEKNPTFFGKWFRWLFPSQQTPFLNGDPAALPVLEELNQDGSSTDMEAFVRAAKMLIPSPEDNLERCFSNEDMEALRAAKMLILSPEDSLP